MVKDTFKALLQEEIDRIDKASVSKRKEHVISGFETRPGRAPLAIVEGKHFAVWNSNDYLGLRFHPFLKEGERLAAEKYGVSPGAVRFISGTSSVHKELEKELAHFHRREECILFSSAFAANLAVIHAIAKGQSKDSLVSDSTLIISDELNHRSIIDGIRVANFPREQKAVFKHMDVIDLRRILEENKGKWKRVIVATDGVFSMLGEYQDLSKMNAVIADFQDAYEEGIISMVDDCHGVAAFGKSGRGTEEVSGSKADLLIGTLGKGFGAEGGYVVGDKVLIDYFRESAATYIFSNPISPGSAGAGFASVRLVTGLEGQIFVRKLQENIAYFKQLIKKEGFALAADSIHPIQPILIGDAAETRKLVDGLYKRGVLVTNISYPVVPKGKDEIRVQVSALHAKEDILEFVKKAKDAAVEAGIL